MDDYRTRLLLALKRGGKAKKSRKGKKGDSGIHINPKNEGTFTKSAQMAGMGVQEYAAHVLAHKEDYDALTIRRANFARNFGGASHRKASKHSFGGMFPSGIWSLAEGGEAAEDLSSLTGDEAYSRWGATPSEFSRNLTGTFFSDRTGAPSTDFGTYSPVARKSHGLMRDNLNTIDRMLAEAGFDLPQRAALIGTIIHESKGDPSAADDDNGFYGLVQWSPERFPDFDRHRNDLEWQVNKLISEIKEMPEGSWTDGAKGGTVVNHANEGRWNFLSAKTPEEAAFYLNKCYVRPWSSDKVKNHEADRVAAYENRGREARAIYDLYAKAQADAEERARKATEDKAMEESANRQMTDWQRGFMWPGSGQ